MSGFGPPRAPMVTGRTKPIAEHARHHAPPGWPAVVLPATEPDWQHSATAFLFDCCPPDFRAHPVLRRHPVVLARLAGHCLEAQLAGMERGVAQLREQLGDHVPSEAIEQSIEALHAERARTQRQLRGVRLVEEALRGASFIRRL